MSRHKGFISIHMAFTLLCAGFIIWCAIKMVPVYVDNAYVKDALRFLAKSNPDLHELSKSEIRSQIAKYITINTIGATQSSSFQVHKTADVTFVNSVYEVRVPVVANVEALLVFKNQISSESPGECCQYKVDNWKPKNATKK